MRLIDNWKTVLTHSWVVWVSVISALLNGVSVTVYFLTATLPMPPIWLILLNGVLAAAVPLLRLLPQKTISGDKE